MPRTKRLERYQERFFQKRARRVDHLCPSVQFPLEWRGFNDFFLISPPKIPVHRFPIAAGWKRDGTASTASRMGRAGRKDEL